MRERTLSNKATLRSCYRKMKRLVFDIACAHGSAIGRHVSLSLGAAIAFVVVNLLLVAVCLFTLRQNTDLRAEAARATAMLTLPNGAMVPPLAGKDWTGTQQVVGYDGPDPRPTLVYTFSMGCPTCQENWSAIRSLQALAPRRLRIVYIDDNGDVVTAKYMAENGIRESVLLVELSPLSAGMYNARAVPQVLLVDRHGRVQWSRLGKLAPRDISKVRSLIGRD